jgi:hypothetical protein
MARKRVLAPRKRVSLMLDVKTLEALSILGENRSRTIEKLIELGLGALLSELKGEVATGKL